jgi:hypothetical protein
VLLVVVAVISSVLDNFAAVLIGSPIPRHRRDLQCRGSGSVVGDPTTMMRIDGVVSPLSVLEAFVAASVPLVVFGFPATIQQRRYLRSSRMRRPGRESNRRECSSSPSSRLQRSPPTSLPTYAFLPEAKSAGHCYGMAGTSPWLISSGSSSCCRCSVGIPTRHTGKPLVIPGAATAAISCARRRGFPLIVLVCPKALLVTHRRPTRLRSTTRRPRPSSLGGPSASLRGY